MYKCDCCEKETLPAKGSYEICPECMWEDDPSARWDDHDSCNANGTSLINAKRYYAQYGACDQHACWCKGLPGEQQ